MRHRSVTPTALLVAALAASGCAHQAYPGDPRPIEQLAVVVTSLEPGWETKQVLLEGISGVPCPGSECIGSTEYAHLLPGSYDFRVKFETFHQPSMFPPLDLYSLVDDLIAAVKHRDLKRRVHFSVEAGKTYEIYFDQNAATYFLFVLNGVAEEPDRPPMRPPPGAEPCAPSTGGNAPRCEADR